MGITLAAAIFAVIAMSGGSAGAQSNPYRIVENWAKLPDGRTWGATSAISVDRSGDVWVFERCAATTCAGSSLAPILKFDPSGNLLKSFGEGMFVFPHDIYVDKDGNVWVVDGQGKDGKGQQVVKFSPEGKVMLTLGKIPAMRMTRRVRLPSDPAPAQAYL
jgi:streptogramin lyase